MARAAPHYLAPPRPRNRRPRNIAIGGTPLRLERLDRRHGRHAVQRHLDDGRDTAGGGGTRGGVEALPLGPARLVDVHVCVDHARHHHQVRRIVQRTALGQIVEGGDGRDRAVADVQRDGRIPSVVMTRRLRTTNWGFILVGDLPAL